MSVETSEMQSEMPNVVAEQSVAFEPEINIESLVMAQNLSGDGNNGDDGGDGETKQTEQAEQAAQDAYIKSKLLASDSEKESDDDDTDEDETDMLRKLEKDAYSDILLNYHPETKHANYNEILAMCKIVRDSNGIVSDDMHKTLTWLTKYERARVLGLRSKQLSYGADAFIDVPAGMISGYKIAVEELSQKKIPFIIRRPIPNGGSEYWKLEDLELLNSY